MALIVSVLAVLLLSLVAWRQPGPGSWRLGETLYSFSTSILTTVLGIGVLTLLWEYTLRKSYAESLHHYISLKGSLVATGLASVNTRQDAVEDRVPAALRNAREVRCATRRPLDWASQYFHEIVKAARHHEIHLELLFPDVDGASIQATAHALSLKPADLETNVQRAEEMIRTIWSQGAITNGSSISILTVDGPLFDALCVDGDAVIEVPTAVGHSVAGRAVVFWFDRHGHVAEWVAGQFDEAQVGAALWAAPSGSQSHFRRSL